MFLSNRVEKIRALIRSSRMPTIRMTGAPATSSNRQSSQLPPESDSRRRIVFVASVDVRGRIAQEQVEAEDVGGDAVQERAMPRRRGDCEEGPTIIVRENRIPLKLDCPAPNDEPLASIEETESIIAKGEKDYASASEMFAALKGLTVRLTAEFTSQFKRDTKKLEKKMDPTSRGRQCSPCTPPRS